MQITAATEAEYKIPKDFQWVLILLMATGLQYLVTIYGFTMKARISAFTASFME